ncbi:MAG: hypothetical protein AAF333_15640 [Planctomycetota bacterium]
MTRAHRPAFSLVEALILIGVVAVLIAVLLPILAYQRKQQRITQNATQLGGIHQSFVAWTSSSKRGRPTAGFFFPGLDWNSGTVTPDGPKTEFSGDGAHPAARFALLLNANFFTHEYILNPVDPSKTAALPNADGEYTGVKSAHYSYAVLALPGSDNERAEWTETLNPSAYVLADRAIGTGPNDVTSVWSTPHGTPAGTWTGHVAGNDGRVDFAASQTLNHTRYGAGAVNRTDDLFADDPAADDAFLVHQDATTAYSAE